MACGHSRKSYPNFGHLYRLQADRVSKAGFHSVFWWNGEMERTEPALIDPLEAASFHPWTQNKINTENIQTLSDLRNSEMQINK